MTKSEIQPEDKAPTFQKGQKFWVEAQITKICQDGKLIETNIHEATVYVYPEELFTTKQIVNERLGNLFAPQALEIPLIKAELESYQDRTRKFKKGDKVRVVARWGRKPWLNCSCLKLGEVYTVSMDENEEDEEVYLKLPSNTDDSIPPFFLDLVEPAPEPKYWLLESPHTYSIYYNTEQKKRVTAMYMRKNLYTLEEAQDECERLNQKKSHEASK